MKPDAIFFEAEASWNWTFLPKWRSLREPEGYL
jgi:hypothetical protein